MTLVQAAAKLGLTPDTLRQQIHAGKLQAEKHGRDWWVTPKEVERYRLEHRRANDPLAVPETLPVHPAKSLWRGREATKGKSAWRGR